MRLINVVFLRTLSEIKLKRTDTTLDLSQKAKRAGKEKKKNFVKDGGAEGSLYLQEVVCAGASASRFASLLSFSSLIAYLHKRLIPEAFFLFPVSRML